MKPPSTFFGSFRYAARGIWHSLRHQRNFRIHVSVAFPVTALAWLMDFTRLDWIVLIVAMTLVLSLELINTGIESAVDLASPGFHPVAGAAKDAAAGAVLLGAAASALLGVIIYIPYLRHFGGHFMVRWQKSPTLVIVWCLGLAVSYALLWIFVPCRDPSEGGPKHIGGTP